MSARGVVPAFDELEAGDAGLGLGAELPPFEQLTFEGGEEALAHGVEASIFVKRRYRPIYERKAGCRFRGRCSVSSNE